MTDPIADLLTRIRNAIAADHEYAEIPAGGSVGQTALNVSVGARSRWAVAAFGLSLLGLAASTHLLLHGARKEQEAKDGDKGELKTGPVDIQRVNEQDKNCGDGQELNPAGAAADEEKPFDIRVNHPLKVGRTSVFLIGQGYAPVFRVTDAKGDVVFEDAVNVARRRARRPSRPASNPARP